MRYLVTGRVADLRLPPPVSPARGDQLWQHSCFEAFLTSALTGPYYEFNFSPSRQWAAYRLSSYRSGMSEAALTAAPDIALDAQVGSLEVLVSVALDGLPDLSIEASWRLGISVILETIDGGKSYWAMAHPPGEPDFHHPDCFAAELAAAEAS